MVAEWWEKEENRKYCKDFKHIYHWLFDILSLKWNENTAWEDTQKRYLFKTQSWYTISARKATVYPFKRRSHIFCSALRKTDSGDGAVNRTKQGIRLPEDHKNPVHSKLRTGILDSRPASQTDGETGSQTCTRRLRRMKDARKHGRIAWRKPEDRKRCFVAFRRSIGRRRRETFEMQYPIQLRQEKCNVSMANPV